jgi:hypothetical protein
MFESDRIVVVLFESYQSVFPGVYAGSYFEAG